MPARWVTAPQVRDLLGPTALGQPRYRQLADGIRLLIVDGRLTLGVRMPSERDLASTMGLSRSTVTAGYLRLRERGYLQVRQGSGHYVCLPDADRTGSYLPNAVVDDGTDVINLAYASGPAPIGVGDAFAAAAARLPQLLVSHGYFPDGVRELRVGLADWFGARGLPTSADQLVITAGALSALNIVVRTLLTPGDRALLESPTYPNAIDVIRASARPIAYPLPEAGWDPADFELILRQGMPRMSYLIPDFQNPTGAWMTEQARPEIAAALQRYRSVPVIDETLVELSLDRAPPRTPLAAYLPDAITIGSASKAFWGGLRIGWIRAPRDLVRPLIQTRAVMDLGAAPFEQLVLAELLSDQHTILATQRDLLREQRDHLLAGLQQALPDWTTSTPSGGLSVWATLPDEFSSRLAGLAPRHGLVVTPGPRFFVSAGGERQIRVPYTATTDTLTEAVRRLRALWSDVQSSGSGRETAALGLTA